MWSHVSKHRDGQSEKERQIWVGWRGRAYTSLLITQNWEEWLISPRTPWQDGKTVWQEPHEVQQGKVQNPASGEKQSQAPVYSGGHPVAKHLSYAKRLRELGPFRLEKRQLWGDPTSVYKHLKGGSKEDEARLFPSVPSDRTGDNGHKLKHKRSSSNIKEHFFPVRVTEHWHRFPREIVESPSLEIFESHLDTVLSNQL